MWLHLIISVLISLVFSSCGSENSNSEVDGLRGLDKRYVLRTNSRLDSTSGLHKHTLVVCKIRETYTLEVQDEACRPALRSKRTGDILVFNKTVGPSLLDKVKGPAKAAGFLVFTAAGVWFGGNLASFKWLPKVKVKPNFKSTTDKVKGLVSSTERAKEVIPGPLFQGIVGVSAVSLSSTFTIMFLSNIPGHGDREVVKYWQDLFGPYGAPHIYEFPYAIKIDNILESAAEANEAEVIWKNVEWAKKP